MIHFFEKKNRIEWEDNIERSALTLQQSKIEVQRDVTKCKIPNQTETLSFYCI